MTIDEYRAKKRKESAKRCREKKLREGRCVSCGKQDAFTMIGKVRCAECSDKDAELKRKLNEGPAHKEKERLKRIERNEQRQANGLCIQCGRKAGGGYKYCPRCRAKDRNRKRRQRQGKSFARGTILCWQCNKEIPILGHKLCQSCYEKKSEICRIMTRLNAQRKAEETQHEPVRSL